MNGQGGSGKTTVEKFAEEYLNSINKKVQIISMVDKVKDCAKFFGWNGEKEPKDRKMFSQLKDLLTEWNDIPYKDVCDKIKNSTADIIFIDAREAEDILRLEKDFNAFKVLVVRNSFKSYGNHADDNVFDERIVYNYIIDNNKSLEDLKEKTKDFIDKMIEM